MKKILTVFILGLVSFVIGYLDVSAIPLNYSRSGYYFEKSNGADIYTSYHLENYTIDNYIAYCLELGIPEGNDYHIGSYHQTRIDSDTMKKLALIAYYGYTYPNHQTDKYRAATQALIWETELGNNISIKYSTERYGKGEKIDDSKERNEIMNLVNHHYDLPSFAKQSFKIQLGEELTLVDENNIFHNYEMVNNELDLVFDEDKLTIKADRLGTYNFAFKKKNVYDDRYKIFYEKSKQSLITAGNLDTVYFNINVEVVGGNVELNKLDSKTKTNKPQGDATLEGAIYGVYKEDGTLLEKIVTNKEGYSKSNNLPGIGNYYLQEISPSKGYLLDENKYYFTIDINHPSAKVETYENVINNDIEILKLYEIKKDELVKAEVGVKFGFYDKLGKLITKKVTDKNGRISLNLPYGKYIVKQLSTIPDYKLADDFEIIIDENTMDTIYKTIVNRQVRGSIEILKLGEEVTFENNNINYKERPLNEVLFEVRALEDIIIYNDKYYSKDELVTTLKTNQDGYASLNELPLGKYYLKEIESSSGHKLDNNIYKFELTKDNTKISYKLNNYLPKGDLVFKKIDSKTKEGISNTLIGIYLDNNLIYSGYTDKDGYINLKNIPVSKNYYLKELEPSIGYELNNEIINFEIEDNKDKEIVMTNDKKEEKILIDVPDTYIRSSKTLIFFIISIGIVMLKRK